jgi:hypothetical protein
VKQSLDEALKGAFPATAVPATLADRVGHLSLAKPRQRPYFRVAIACGTAALAFGSIAFLAPRAQAITTLSRISGAVDALPAWHFVTYAPDLSGKLTKSGETWSADGRVREVSERGKTMRYLVSGETILYRQGEPYAMRLPGRNASDQIQRLSGFVRQMQTSVYMQRVEVRPNQRIEGRAATQLISYAKAEPVRVTLAADSRTDIPFLATVESRVGNGWQVVRRIDIDTNPVPTAKVALDLPAGVEVVDEKVARQQWIKRLSKPLGAYVGDHAPLEVRDVWVNREGVVFVLYTNGRSNRLGGGAQDPLELIGVKDDRGTRYLSGESLQGTMYTTKGEFVRGLVIDGREVQAAFFVPAKPAAGEPRTLQISFGQVIYRVPEGFQPKGPAVSIKEMRRTVTNLVTHRATLTSSPETLPAWMPFMGSGPREMSLESEIARLRARDALATGDWDRAVREAREHLRITQLEAAVEGQSYRLDGNYDLLGEALYRQGNYGEARRAWQEALDRANDAGAAERIRREMAQLPQVP